MSTKHYAVIGHPIGHTMSPFIHKRLFNLSGIDAEYGVIDIAPENLAQEYEKTLKKLEKSGLNLLQFGDDSDIISRHFARERTFPHVAARLGGGVEVPGGKKQNLEEKKCQ